MTHTEDSHADLPTPLESSSGVESRADFESLSRQKPLSLVTEFCLFVRENKAWWLVPIMIALAGLGLLAAFGSTGAAPFIYTLF